MAERGKDWARILERLLEGDPIALMELSRLINSFLRRDNAYDFKDEWDDLIQEVILAAATAMRDGKIREPAAVVGFLRTTARFKFIDRLKLHLRRQENDHLPWEDVLDGPSEPTEDGISVDLRRDVRSALDGLDENPRIAVMQCRILDKSVPEAARDTGIPEGSLKRYLKQGLAELRNRLAPILEK